MATAKKKSRKATGKARAARTSEEVATENAAGGGDPFEDLGTSPGEDLRVAGSKLTASLGTSDDEDYQGTDTGVETTTSSGTSVSKSASSKSARSGKSSKATTSASADTASDSDESTGSGGILRKVTKPGRQILKTVSSKLSDRKISTKPAKAVFSKVSSKLKKIVKTKGRKKAIDPRTLKEQMTAKRQALTKGANYVKKSASAVASKVVKPTKAAKALGARSGSAPSSRTGR